MAPQSQLQHEIRRINALHVARLITNAQRHERIREELNRVARTTR